MNFNCSQKLKTLGDKRIPHKKMGLTSPPPKKLLITDPKPAPKPGPPTAASSSSTTTAPPEKRTRDQPNLSDCHSCGRRINQTNPKDRLQPLDSLWRIVLLCRKCRKTIHSGKTCPYCFKEISSNSGDNCLKCGSCERRIHRDCVRSYGNCTPWCYLGEGGVGEFRVCVDCWVPELLKSSIRVCEKAKKGAKVREGARRDVGAEDCVDENGEGGGDAELAIRLHRAMNSSPRICTSKCSVDSSGVRKWKGLCYKRSRFLKGQKLGGCGDAVESGGRNRLGVNGTCVGGDGLNGGLLRYKRDKKRKIWVLDDEYALISSSRSALPAEPEIDLRSDDVRTRFSMKNGYDQSDCCVSVDRFGKVPIMYGRRKWKEGLVYCLLPVPGKSSRPGKSKFKLRLDGNRTRCAVKKDADLMEVSVHLNGDQSDSCINVDKFRKVPLIYKRTRWRVDRVNPLMGVSGECSHCDNGKVVLESECRQLDDTKDRIGDVEGVLPIGSCDAERDRYHLKYCRKVKGTKSESSLLCSDTFLRDNKASVLGLDNPETGYSLNSDTALVLPNVSSIPVPDRYGCKYVRRAKGSKSDSNFGGKLQSNVRLDDTGTFAPGLNMNCTAESRTASDVSFDSFTTHLPK